MPASTERARRCSDNGQTNKLCCHGHICPAIHFGNSTVPGNLPTFFPANSILEFVAEHILYIGKKIGFEHVRIGSDYCGISDTPKGLEDVAKFPDLVREYCRRGLRDDEIEGIIGGNVLRVWRRVEEVSAEMQARGELPMEDEI